MFPRVCLRIVSRRPFPDNRAMDTFFVAGLIGCVSLLYATAGQAGGTAFLAVMAFAAFPAIEMRATALVLNIVAAAYATWRLHRRAVIDRKTLVTLTAPSLVTAFVGGTLVLAGQAYFILTGMLLIAAAALMVFKRAADVVEARPVHFLGSHGRGGSRIYFWAARRWWRRVPNSCAYRLRLGIA